MCCKLSETPVENQSWQLNLIIIQIMNKRPDTRILGQINIGSFSKFVRCEQVFKASMDFYVHTLKRLKCTIF